MPFSIYVPIDSNNVAYSGSYAGLSSSSLATNTNHYVKDVSGTLVMKPTNSANGVLELNSSNAIPSTYLSSYLPLAGGTMSGTISGLTTIGGVIGSTPINVSSEIHMSNATLTNRNLTNVGEFDCTSVYTTGTVTAQQNITTYTNVLIPDGQGGGTLVGNLFFGTGAGGSAGTRMFHNNGGTCVDTDGSFAHRDLSGNAKCTITSSGDMTLAGNNATKTTGTTWSNPSDSRIKTDIVSFTDGLDCINALQPVTYKFNSASGLSAGDLTQTNIGFIAQDVNAVCPYMVSVVDDSSGPTQLSDKHMLDESALTKILVNAIHELSAKLVSLQARVTALEA